MRTLALIFGGDSCEHDVSVITGFMTKNVVKKNYRIYPVYLKNGSFWTGEKLDDIKFFSSFDEKRVKETFFSQGKLVVKKGFGLKYYHIDCALVCTHGGAGENGGLSGYLDLAGVPYTCTNVFGSSLCMDKVYCKMLLEKLKFPVVTYRIFRKGYKIEKAEELGYPIIVKPARSGSSVGISFARTREELEKAIDFALKFDDKLLLEKGLTDFREFNCAACYGQGKVILSEVEEPVFNKDFLDFYDKYTDASAKRVIPADIDDKLMDKIKRITKEIYLLLELKGVVRIDFLYAEKKLYVNEINTIPGSLATYLFGKGAGAAKSVIDYMVEDAIRDNGERRKLVSNFTGDILKNYKNTGKLSGMKK